MSPPTHEETSELLGPFTRGELDSRAANEVRAHLQSCPACRAEHEGLVGLRAAAPPVGQDALTADERARLRARVMDAVGQRRADDSDGAATASHPGARTVRWLGAAAALLVLGVAAAGLGLMSGGGGGGSGGSAATSQKSTASGPQGEGAPAHLGARFDRHAGRLSPATLSMLADAAGPGAGESGDARVALAFRAAQSTPGRIALSARHALLDELSRAAPADAAAQISICGGRIITRHVAVPLYGGLGRFEGKPALVLGFATADNPRGALNRYTFWVFGPERCDRIARVSGPLAPTRPGAGESGSGNP